MATLSMSIVIGNSTAYLPSRMSLKSQTATRVSRFRGDEGQKGLVENPSVITEDENASCERIQHLRTKFESTYYPDVSNIWYLVATAAVLAFHREDLMDDIWQQLILDDKKHIQGKSEATNLQRQLRIARRVREACLKCSVLVGFPRAINALAALQTSISTHSPELLPFLNKDHSLRDKLSPEAKLSRGKKFFTKLYNRHAARVEASLAQSSGGELNHFALTCVYGELMAEVSIINEMETVILEFACCLGDHVGRQAKGHFYGAQNMGASLGMLAATVRIVREVGTCLRKPCNWEDDDFGFLSKLDLVD